MGRLDDISIAELHELRTRTEGEVPRERVLAAIGRKHGDTLDTLAERHNVVEKTIRNWLDRFDREPIEQAPYDGPRSGRPSDLTDAQREELFETLQQPSIELGYEQQAWSTKLFLHHVRSVSSSAIDRFATRSTATPTPRGTDAVFSPRYLFTRVFPDRITAGQRLGDALADRGMVALERPARFRAVGAHYREFDQVSDAEAMAYLGRR